MRIPHLNLTSKNADGHPQQRIGLAIDHDDVMMQNVITFTVKRDYIGKFHGEL